MAHDPKALRPVLEAAAPPDAELTLRAMFGGLMAYAAGRPFASLSDMGLALKISGAARDELLALPGSAPLRYEPDAPPSKSYVVVPEGMLGDPTALREWIERSIASLGTARPKAKRNPKA